MRKTTKMQARQLKVGNSVLRWRVPTQIAIIKHAGRRVLLTVIRSNGVPRVLDVAATAPLQVLS